MHILPMTVSPEPSKVYSEGPAAPADDGPSPRVPLPSELGSRLSQLITATPGEEPWELVVSEVVSARILGIGLKPLSLFCGFPKAAGISLPSRKYTV